MIDVLIGLGELVGIAVAVEMIYRFILDPAARHEMRRFYEGGE